MSIDLAPHHLDCVRNILKLHVPDCEVWVFGSRAGTARKPFSDLDLAIVAPTPLPTRQLALLANAFEESDLPIRVDIVEWQTVPLSFQQQIARNHEVIVRPGEPAPTAFPSALA